MPPSSATNSAAPAPKVEQVLHVRAKSILSCKFGRSANSTRTGIVPPASYQTVTVNGVTALLHLDSHDATVRTVGNIQWNPTSDTGVIDATGKEKAQAPTPRVSVGENTADLPMVLRKNKGVGKDLKLKAEVRTIHLPGLEESAPLHFQRVAMPSGGFPYTVYTIADKSLPPGPTHAHICVGQLTIKRSSKSQSSSASGSKAAILPFFSGRSQPRSPAPVPTPTPEDPEAQGLSTTGVVVRLELRTRDKALIDRIVFSSLLVVAGKHPVEADSRVEIDRPTANEWDAPPALTTLATPQLSPNASNEHLPLASPPVYQGESSSQRYLLAGDSSQELLGSDPFRQPGSSMIGMAPHTMSAHSSTGSGQSIASAA